MRVITFIGLITFIISCFLPCFSVRDSSFDYIVDTQGMRCSVSLILST